VVRAPNSSFALSPVRVPPLSFDGTIQLAPALRFALTSSSPSSHS
jgi:hypothetical protein